MLIDSIPWASIGPCPLLKYKHLFYSIFIVISWYSSQYVHTYIFLYSSFHFLILVAICTYIFVHLYSLFLDLLSSKSVPLYSQFLHNIFIIHVQFSFLDIGRKMHTHICVHLSSWCEWVMLMTLLKSVCGFIYFTHFLTVCISSVLFHYQQHFLSLSVSTTFSNWSLQKIIFVYIYVFLTIYLYKFSSVS